MIRKNNSCYRTLTLLSLSLFSTIALAEPEQVETVHSPAPSSVYFGDLHIHTSFSNDAYTMGVRSTPDDTYIFAKGGTIKHAFGYPISLSKPLDFAAVTDHAEYLGLSRAKDVDGSAASNDFKEVIDKGSRLSITWTYIKALASFGLSGWGEGEINAPYSYSAWSEIRASAERHYEPGKFTTFVGYEWSPIIDMASMHRNIIYRSSHVPEIPYSSVESLNAEDLWDQLKLQSLQGMIAISIPHNGNMSNGKMWETQTFNGEPLSPEYAELRNALEPIAEIMQIKGQSETHPLLSNEDEFADFEINDINFRGDASNPKGSYARDALRTGLEYAHREGFNPFKFGVIGSTDSHNSSSPVEEDNYHGKQPIIDGTPGIRLNESLLIPKSFNMASNWGSGGLAAVWAKENTREALFDAMRRKETYATSGPRIQVRFFGSWNFSKQLLEQDDPLVQAYQQGVPMGGLLPATTLTTAPAFAVWASKDPDGANLDRIQIIKAWVDNDGKSHEQVYDVAASDQRITDPVSGKLAKVGNTVDITTASYRNSIGAVQLAAVWRDPTFVPDTEAFYYARVIEIPTPRWSTYDAVKLGVEPPQPTTLQERAVTSAIWYQPANNQP